MIRPKKSDQQSAVSDQLSAFRFEFHVVVGAERVTRRVGARSLKTARKVLLHW
jgi:hypothetical protein